MGQSKSIFDREENHRLDKKLVAITGASDGIGLSTAIMCAQRGASLLLLCRNIEKMSAAASKIRESTPDAQICEIQVDLANVKTVSNAVEEIKEKRLMIDILVLNAGLAYFEPTENLYNINSIQVVNHFSHFYLLNELLSNLKGSEEDPARVIALASDAHTNATGDGRFWKTYSSSEEMASVLGTGIKKNRNQRLLRIQIGEYSAHARNGDTISGNKIHVGPSRSREYKLFFVQNRGRF